MHVPEFFTQQPDLKSARDKASVDKKIALLRELNKPEIYDIDLTGLVLPGGDLRGFILRYGRLDGASLSGANLTETDFEGSWIVKADLTRANLSNSNQRAVSFQNSDLTEATLQHGVFGVNFTGAKLGGSRRSARS